MKDKLEFKLVTLGNRDEYNLILAQAHFIKTVEDAHEAIVNCVPDAKFGLAFNEASGARLVRKSGTKEDLISEAVRIAKLVGAGHLLVIVLENVYPINVLTKLKDIPELVTVFCASANPVQVVVAKTEQGRGVVGVIDGRSPLGVEGEKEAQARNDFLRQIGYKL